MTYFKPLLLSFAIVLFFGIMAYGDSRLSTSEGGASYPVVFGERPPIDLNSLPDDAWESGRLKIKLTPEMGRSIPPEPIVAGNGEYVITGNHSLDALNQRFNVKSYQPLFAPLYQTGTRSTAFAARHEAWGFHLWFELIVDEETNIIDAVKAFSALSEVSFAEPEYRKQLVIDDPGFGYPDPVKIPDATAGERWTPNDPQYSNHWHYNNTGQQNGTPGADISLQDAWVFEKGNENIIVAIVDGGIDYAHSDLAGNMWPGIGYNFVTNSANVTPHNHGTHVAGTVAAVSNNNVGVAGVAGGTGSGNGVRLMSCQVFTTSSNGGFALAPVYAADNGASISQNSWGYTNPGVYDQSVLNAIDYFNINGGGLAMSGGITIFAAGNSNSTGQWYPGYYSGCFSVAATNNQDQKSWYSNFDTWIDISAPGGETNQVSARGVLSTLNNNSYGYYQGTSMACPHASGVAALMISYAYGQLSSTDVADILRNTTDDHYAVNPGFIGQLGTGRLNANAAMLYVDGLMSGVLNPINFAATALSDEDISLSWIKNPANDSVMIAWSPDDVFGTPVNGKNYQPGHAIPGGGIVIYFGADNSAVHERLDHSTTYYYRAFSKNTQLEYSTGVSASATTTAAPHADFLANPTIAMIGETITFTDASYPGNFSTYVWDFGSGAAPATASGAGPHSVIYNTTGSKTVSLTVDGTLTETKENYITITSVIYSTSATYTSGHISTDRNFTTLPGASNCPATLTLNIPQGAVITSTDVSYQMTALNNGWKSEQRSQLRCVSDGGAFEEQLFTGTGNSSGTQAYNRTGLGIANDVVGGGDIAFEMHAGRTWGGSGCNPTYNRVDNNTWTITVHYILTDLPEADFTASNTIIFEGETVDFFDLSTNEPDAWSWSFEGGTPSVSNLQNPSITYAEAGVYDVSLTVANAFGTDTETKTGFITVNSQQQTIADFTADNTLIEQGDVVQFFDLSTGGPTFWHWQIQGASPAISYKKNPVVIFNQVGIFDVQLTVSGPNGQDTMLKEGYIEVTEVNCPFPPGWEHEPTSTMHVIAVTLESNPRLFESPLEAGDFVGVFYHDDNGELKCGGACQWDGTENIAVTAFGNNFFTPFKDGFDVNETFHWKIYSMEKSLSFDAVPSYDDQTPYQEKFFPMGMSALTDLYAGVLFEVIIPQGWSGISSPLLPVPMSMDDMFAAVQQDLSILYNFDGMYWPGENINTLGQWEINGYTIKMDNSATFEFAGDYMRNPVYQINAGTVYLPVLSPCEVDVESLFAPHLNHLFLVRNITGTEVYWPALGINTIGSFIPGRSYLVLSTGDYDLAFPECEPANKTGLTVDSYQGFIETPWGQITITPQVHTVGLTALANDILQPGDIIGIFTKDGTIAGSAHYQGNNLVIPVFGNDITTAAQDGFINGEPMHLKAFRPTEEVEFELDAVWDLTMPDQELFNAGGVSVIAAFKPPDNVIEHFATSGQILIYPNPGSGVINISGLDDTRKLTIMQPDGRIITTIPHDGGNHKSIDLGQLPAGLYLIRTAGSYGFRVNKLVIE